LASWHEEPQGRGLHLPVRLRGRTMTMKGRGLLAVLVMLGGVAGWALWPEASLPAGTVVDKLVLH